MHRGWHNCDLGIGLVLCMFMQKRLDYPTFGGWAVNGDKLLSRLYPWNLQLCTLLLWVAYIRDQTWSVIICIQSHAIDIQLTWDDIRQLKCCFYMGHVDYLEVPVSFNMLFNDIFLWLKMSSYWSSCWYLPSECVRNRGFWQSVSAHAHILNVR